MVTVSNAAVAARSIGVVGDEAFKGSLWFITGEPGKSGNAGIARL